MHDSLETKAEKECLAWMYPVYQGVGIFRYMIAEPSSLNFDLYPVFFEGNSNPNVFQAACRPQGL